MLEKIRKFATLRNEDGASAVEYGLWSPRSRPSSSSSCSLSAASSRASSRTLVTRSPGNGNTANGVASCDG